MDLLNWRAANYVPEHELSADLLHHLQARYYLTDKTPEQEREEMLKYAEQYARVTFQTPQFTFLTTYNCNFACVYCYETPVRAHQSLAPMTLGQVHQAFNAIDHLARGRRFNLDLFGGEPLLPSTRDSVLEIVRCAQQRSGHLSATTNAYHLDLFRDCLGPDAIKYILVTLDGPEAIHNTRRRAANGMNTFSRILDNLSIAVEQGVTVDVRVNVDRNTISDLPLLFDQLNDRGMLSKPRLTYEIRTLKPRHQIREADVMTYGETIQRLREMVGEHPLLRHVRLFDRNLIDLFVQPGALPPLKPTHCYATVESYFFDPLGEIYTCTEAVGMSGMSIGRYVPSLRLDADSVERWKRHSMSFIPECQRCPYALLCGGGCAFTAFCSIAGDMTPACQGFAGAITETLAWDLEAFLREHPASEFPVVSKT